MLQSRIALEKTSRVRTLIRLLLPAIETLMQQENGFKTWFYSIPPFTRTYLVILLLTGFGSAYGLFDPFTLVFSRELILKRLEVSTVIFGKL